MAENKKITFSVITDASWVELRLYSDCGTLSLPFARNNCENCFILKTQFKSGLYFYNIVADGKIFGKGENYDAEENREPWQLTVYPCGYTTPDWVKGGIIYQIFPDRFCRVGDFSVASHKVKRSDWGGLPNFRSADGKVRNNEFFGGNFKGIESKLGYLEGLGVDIIYFNPISESYSSHRYDTGDYLKPDGVLGTERDLKNLIDAADQKNIYFVFDGVYNHTGAGSRYFNKYGDYDSIGAYNSTASPYFEWYSFRSFPNDYNSWWEFKTLPSIRRDCESFQTFISGDNGVIDHYLSMGMRGVRLDVVDELSSDFVDKIRVAVKKHNGFLIGEVWEDATNKIAYDERRRYYTGGQLDSTMNYPLRSALINYAQTGDCTFLKNTVLEQMNNYPKCALDCLMNILSTHDSPRIITVLGRRFAVLNKDEMAFEKLDKWEYERGKMREMCISAIQFFIYGIPSVYYGDEEGLEGDLDPYNRKCYDWNNQDKELLEHYRKLSKIRKKYSVFKDGNTRIINARKGLFMFTREKGGTLITVAVNLDLFTHIIKTNSTATDLYGGTKGTKFELKPYGILVLKG